MRDGDSRGGTRIANPNRQCAVLVDAMVLSLVSHHEIRRGHFAAMKEDEPSICSPIIRRCARGGSETVMSRMLLFFRKSQSVVCEICSQHDGLAFALKEISLFERIVKAI